MCVNPITIKNPKMKTGTFSNKSDCYFMEVPCGHCYECLLQKQQTWIVRNYFHYKYINSIGGAAYFYTLTYNNENLLFGSDFTSNLRPPVKLFNPIKVKLFLKRLNARLSRRGIDFSYYLVSELGGKTDRPHHHAIFYLSKYLNPFTFNKLVTECWNYGFVMPGSNYGLVNSPAAIFYCCKYISKNGKKKKISSLSNAFRSLGSYISRHYGCFSRVSAGLGWNRFVQLNKEDFEKGYIQIPFEGKYKNFPIPLYYKRKLLCESFVNPNGNISYRPNSFGWSVLSNQFAFLYDNLQTKCEILNSIFDIDFSADELLYYRLCNSLPYKCENFDFSTLYFHRKINDGYVTGEFPSLENRVFLDSFSASRKRLFNFINQHFSYENYKKTTESYNIRQRVLYGKSKREVKLLNFNEYVHNSS